MENLMWHWIAANVIDPTMADAQQATDFVEFVDYFHVTSTARAAVNAGDPALPPKTEVAHVPELATPTMLDEALEMVHCYLPELPLPMGMKARLGLLLNQQATNIQQVIVAGQTPRVATIASKHSSLLDPLPSFCEVPDEENLAAFWVVYPNIKSGSWISALESNVRLLVNRGDYRFPLSAPLKHPTLVMSFPLQAQ